MTALQVIEAQIYRETLISFPDVQALVGLSAVPTEYKVFWEHVDDIVEQPYIVTQHLSGGILPNPQYSDTLWKITGHTADMETAQALANAISLLANADPVSTITGVCAVTWIAEVMPVFDRYQAQNVPMFMVGGIYRLRLNLEV